MSKFTNNLVWHLPHRLAHSIKYYNMHKKLLHWRNPETYDEKIHWLMANKYDYTYGKYVDKYLVRDYVAKCGCADMLVPLIGVFETADEINFNTLPNEFILKTTNGSGEDFYERCWNKNNLSKMDEMKIKNKLSAALDLNFAIPYCEYQYSKIHPKIICEKLLKDFNHEWLTDYKVVCTNGTPQRILVCTNRDEGRDYYSTEWEYMDYVKEEYKSGIIHERPECLPEMLEAATVLSQPFPLARVDFYLLNDKIYFSEITLTPSAGNHKNLNEYGQRELGRLIEL